MGQVISFSEFSSYYSDLQKKPDYFPATILDTNILIALTYEVKSSHEEIFDFFEQHLIPRRDQGVRLFTTVTTRSEFLDFNRRLIMTEKLRDLVEMPKIKITARAKAQIQYQSGQLKRREERGGDAVFNDTQIKSIKSAFSAGRFSGQTGWIALCQEFLGGKLEQAEKNLADLGIEYISQHESLQHDLFIRKIDWPDARRTSEATCLGLSDSMILNAFQCSRFSFIVSSDFDIGYSVLASKSLKDVVMPDSVAKKYREYHFDSEVM